ncbi:hypothetical protein [Natrinema marinum]|uniref:hypothetical protein n=1 Tax=Natrinema marinum TaxID=2961598 RepID=UPI0020C9248F|nr:hypothetical protein [Natrinema marinum]
MSVYIQKVPILVSEDDIESAFKELTDTLMLIFVDIAELDIDVQSPTRHIHRSFDIGLGPVSIDNIISSDNKLGELCVQEIITKVLTVFLERTFENELNYSITYYRSILVVSDPIEDCGNCSTTVENHECRGPHIPDASSLSSIVDL